MQFGSILYFFVCPTFLQIGAQENENEDMPGPAAELSFYDRRTVPPVPCVLMRINATIAIELKRTANKKYYVEVPRSAEVEGKCGNGMDSQLLVIWGKSFRLNWHFQKSHVSDAWYVDRISFSYSTAEKIFNEEGNGEVQEIHSPESFTLWLTPIGQAYRCGIIQDIKLLDAKKERRVTISLKKIKIQPFAAMTRHQYGDSFVCPEEAGRRDETVPIAVGSTLAIVVLLTIGGYAGYRYVKVKKIEYDTME